MSHVDHIALVSTTDLIQQEAKFLDAALKPLGISEQFRITPTIIALGTKEHSFLWLSNYTPQREEIKDAAGVVGIHVGFKAKSES